MLKWMCMYLLALEASYYVKNEHASIHVKVIRKEDPHEHKLGQTYTELTNFLHGYVLNMKNIHPAGQCRNECDQYNNLKTEKCFQNKWCKNQPPCPKIISCDLKSTTMEVCFSNMNKTNRRYEFVKSSKSDQIPVCTSGKQFSLETQFRGLFDICDYCFCICEEDTPYSDIFISLRTAIANTSDNRVVTGIRFIKHNRIIYFQIQDGKLMPGGHVDVKSLRWVPVDDYDVSDPNVHEGIDYHKLSWKHRRLYLSQVFADKGKVITGVRFKRIGYKLRLHLEIVVTPVDFTKGKLINPKTVIYRTNPESRFVNKFGKELKLLNPDIPIRSRIHEKSIYTTNKYVEFTYTDYVKDAAQTTVPFFDVQPLEANQPLSGIGIFHRGAKGYGGFIAPELFPYKLRN